MLQPRSAKRYTVLAAKNKSGEGMSLTLVSPPSAQGGRHFCAQGRRTSLTMLASTSHIVGNVLDFPSMGKEKLWSTTLSFATAKLSRKPNKATSKRPESSTASFCNCLSEAPFSLLLARARPIMLIKSANPLPQEQMLCGTSDEAPSRNIPGAESNVARDKSTNAHRNLIGLLPSAMTSSNLCASRGESNVGQQDVEADAVHPAAEGIAAKVSSLHTGPLEGIVKKARRGGVQEEVLCTTGAFCILGSCKAPRHHSAQTDARELAAHSATSQWSEHMCAYRDCTRLARVGTDVPTDVGSCPWTVTGGRGSLAVVTSTKCFTSGAYWDEKPDGWSASASTPCKHFKAATRSCAPATGSVPTGVSSSSATPVRSNAL
mmetsp:Transcript_577/g.2405  ORF Transcript_577/g.2405 Transcript_577/m.2405 type:complete len:375 (-) Transcript_577:1079-2203(-)